MKIARILRNEEEHYVVIKNNSMYSTNINRDDNGIESMFNDIAVGEKLSEISDESITWLPPVARPGKIICVGRNYLKHAEEQNMGAEENPLLFSKYPSNMVGHLSNVEYPSHTENLDYEVELAVIIGKTASRLTEADNPLDFVFGFTVANDLTARDVQKAEKQWTRGKAFDQSLPIGPAIVTRDQIIPLDQEIWLTVNGERRQQSSTSNMMFTVPYLIHYISQQITLYPGDILLTGTPEGVGYYMNPKGVLQSGDNIACGITNVGELRFSISKE
ncbi:MAG: fumarylacetoacetate hydrolase family protein [Candidatus Heimdallarchaeota archaeon]|nr:fumarylacetoacetate hydrolase family protein [Candidatus Heimdallarchaeota archaeon]